MPMTCSICRHAARQAIDRALIARAESNRRIAARFAVAETSLRRHAGAHVPRRLARAHDVREQLAADDLLGQVRSLQRQALAILERARRAGDLRTALSAIAQARGNLELLAKLVGELETAPTVNLLVHPEWIATKQRLLNALQPFPLARQAVAAALLPGSTEVNGDGSQH